MVDRLLCRLRRGVRHRADGGLGLVVAPAAPMLDVLAWAGPKFLRTAGSTRIRSAQHTNRTPPKEEGALMDRSKDWLVPLTGVAFLIVGILAFAIGGEPTSADKPASEVVAFYVDNKDSVSGGAFIAALAAVLLIFFAGYLRKVLHEADGPGEMLSLIAFAGMLVVAVGFAIDATILLALAESAKDIEPAAAQALQALYDNDFIPMVVGVMAFLLATGLSILKSGVLPSWLGWVMIALAVIGATPLGFIAAIGAALMVLVLSIMLSMRARAVAPPDPAV